LQGCTKSGRLLLFFMVASKVSGFSLRNLIHVTLLAPRFLENLCTSLICCDIYMCGPRTSPLWWLWSFAKNKSLDTPCLDAVKRTISDFSENQILDSQVVHSVASHTICLNCPDTSTNKCGYCQTAEVLDYCQTEHSGICIVTCKLAGLNTSFLTIHRSNGNRFAICIRRILVCVDIRDVIYSTQTHARWNYD
jgi:hypothetical protein